MSSPGKEKEEPSSSTEVVNNGERDSMEVSSASDAPRPPAKRKLSNAPVIEISDTESDDSDVCAVISYQATADEVKRIRGEDYSSSSSSSSDYSSDSESPWEDDSILIEDQGEHKVAKAQLNPRANRMDDPKLNTNIASQETIDLVSSYWKDHKDHSSSSVTLTHEPFQVCLLHDLLANPEIINNIVDDMNTLDWSRKKMDLYEFHQTADLASLTWQRSIRGIYELLKTEVMSWVSSVSGLQLTSVSASCSLYGPGDHLLAHDDRCGDRRVAFILYLAPWGPSTTMQNNKHDTSAAENGHAVVDVEDVCGGWLKSMGGALELISCDDNGQPQSVVKEIHPKNNMMALFPVHSRSYHQVGEVLSLELPRLSINGWFHGPEPERSAAEGEAPEQRPVSPHSDPPSKPNADVVVLPEWLDTAYMSPRSRAQVQAHMERDSEVCLHKLLQHSVYQELLQELAGSDIPWEPCGPLNARCYERIPPSWYTSQASPTSETSPESQPSVTRRLLRAWASTAWTRFLHDCTDLVLNQYSNLELQRWTKGNYTLLPPREHYQESRLEAVMYLGVPDKPLSGGGTSYVAPEEGSTGANHEAALVSLPPANNALNLVFCDSGAAAFTKYLSKMTMDKDDCFYIVTCTYSE